MRLPQAVRRLASTRPLASCQTWRVMTFCVLCVAAYRARGEQRAAAADRRIRLVVPEAVLVGGGIAGIEADGEGIEAEALDLTVEAGEIGPAVMDVGGGGVDVGDDGVAPVHRPVVEVEKALRLALADHVTGLRIGPADRQCREFRVWACG